MEKALPLDIQEITEPTFFFLVQEGRHQVLYVPWNEDKNKNNFFKAIKKFKKKNEETQKGI